MAHNTRIRPNLAAWAVGTTVTDVEFDAIDQYCFEAINGDLGGTWAPSALITIGGSGVSLTSAGNKITGVGSLLTVENGGKIYIDNTSELDVLAGGDLTTLNTSNVDFQAGTAMTVACDIGITGTPTFSGTPDFSGNLTFSGDPTFSGSPVFSGTPSITGDCTHSGTSHTTFGAGTELQFSSTSTLTVGSLTTATFANIPSFANGLSVSGGAITFSGAGRMRKRVFTNGADGDITKGINDCDRIVNPNGIFSGNHACTISNVGAVAGDEMEVVNLDVTHNLTAGGLALCTSAGHYVSIRLQYNGASWDVIGTCIYQESP